MIEEKGATLHKLHDLRYKLWNKAHLHIEFTIIKFDPDETSHRAEWWSKHTALDALRNGDIPAVAAVVTDAVPRFVGRSRNTPAPIKKVRVAENRVLQDFTQGSH